LGCSRIPAAYYDVIPVTIEEVSEIVMLSFVLPVDSIDAAESFSLSTGQFVLNRRIEG
jgi:hypothetical protein